MFLDHHFISKRGTLNSVYIKFTFNEKSAIMKQNLHIFFFVIGGVECNIFRHVKSFTHYLGEFRISKLVELTSRQFRSDVWGSLMSQNVWPPNQLALYRLYERLYRECYMVVTSEELHFTFNFVTLHPLGTIPTLMCKSLLVYLSIQLPHRWRIRRLFQ